MWGRAGGRRGVRWRHGRGLKVVLEARVQDAGMRPTVLLIAAGVTTVALAGGAVAFAGGAAPTRLDDGADLSGQASISEAQAIHAARSAATGALNEVDLERAEGRLVYNVDVGAKDVQVDAHSGQVVRVDADD